MAIYVAPQTAHESPLEQIVPEQTLTHYLERLYHRQSHFHLLLEGYGLLSGQFRNQIVFLLAMLRLI